MFLLPVCIPTCSPGVCTKVCSAHLQGVTLGAAGPGSRSRVVWENPHPLQGSCLKTLLWERYRGWAAASTGRAPLCVPGLSVPASRGLPSLRIPLLLNPWPHHRGWGLAGAVIQPQRNEGLAHCSGDPWLEKEGPLLRPVGSDPYAPLPLDSQAVPSAPWCSKVT